MSVAKQVPMECENQAKRFFAGLALQSKKLQGLQ